MSRLLVFYILVEKKKHYISIEIFSQTTASIVKLDLIKDEVPF